MINEIRNKEIRSTIKEALKHGCTLVPGKKHILVLSSEGKRITGFTRCSKHSDHRSALNLRAQLRRGGINVA